MFQDQRTGASFTDISSAIQAAFQRYWRLSFWPTLVVFVLGLLLTFRLPSYYESDAIIYMQPQRVTSQVVATPQKNELNEQLQSVAQEILSRSKLRSIIETNNLYPEYRGSVGIEQAIIKLRDKILITPVESVGGQKENLMQTFRLSFDHHDPKVAYDVANALSNLFIEESIVSQQAEVLGTKEFLDGELRDARALLEKTESQVQEFETQHFGKLPEHLEQAVARLQTAQKQLESNGELIIADSQRLEFLQQELRIVQDAGLAKEGTKDLISGDPRQGLAQLERALEVLQTKYSDKHPDVVNTKKQIDLLKQQLANGGGKASGFYRRGSASLLAGASTDARTVRAQINDLNVEISRLKNENSTLKDTIAKLQKDIEDMPAVEQQMVKIRRDYETVKKNYERLLGASKDAELQSNLVRSQKGAQFKIVEPAAVPVIPAGPNRLIVGAGALGLSLLVLCGSPILFFFLSSSFKFRQEVEDELGIDVLGVVPPMDSPDALLHKRRANTVSMFFSVASCVAGIVVIFFMTN